MNEKFTPGPWHENYSKFSQVKAANGAIVATCNRLSNLVNLQANAHLISAAPEMYEAMNEFCDRCDKGEVRSKRTYSKFMEILKKARGES